MTDEERNAFAAKLKTATLKELGQIRDNVLKAGWDWAETYIEQMIVDGLAMEETGNFLKAGREAGLSVKYIRLAHTLSMDRDRTREAFQRCLRRAMRKADMITINDVVNEWHRLNWMAD